MTYCDRCIYIHRAQLYGRSIVPCNCDCHLIPTASRITSYAVALPKNVAQLTPVTKGNVDASFNILQRIKQIENDIAQYREQWNKKEDD